MIGYDGRPPITYRARRHLWLRPGEALVCPNGHRLKHNAAILGGQEAFVCQHKAERGGGECGARAYLMLIPGGLRFLAEVTPAEVIYMRDSHMSVEEVLAFLQGGKAA
jgi:hypothetical protein